MSTAHTQGFVGVKLSGACAAEAGACAAEAGGSKELADAEFAEAAELPNAELSGKGVAGALGGVARGALAMGQR